MFVQKRKSNKESMLKDESGAVVVIVAMAMVVLLMFVSLTVDYGMMYLQAAKLQTACDAAAMAAASQLPNVELAKYEAQEIMEANGFDLDVNSELSINDEKTEVEVVKKIDVKTSFAQVMNIQKMVTQKKAKASSVNTKKKFQLDYALFSGSQTESLPLWGACHVSGGKVHTNNAIEEVSNGSSLDVEKEFTYVNEAINCQGTTVTTGTSDQIEVQPMPDYHDSIMGQIPSVAECTYYNNVSAYIAANPSNLVGNQLTIAGNVRVGSWGSCSYSVVVLGNLIIDSVEVADGESNFEAGVDIGSATQMGAIYVMDPDNDMKVSGLFRLNGYCVAEQSIEFQQYSMTECINAYTQSVLYSVNEDIVFGGASNRVFGLVYAPEGAVSVTDYSVHVYNGGVIADVIDISKGSFTINKYDSIEFDMEMDDDSGNSGVGKTKLVE